MSKAAHEAETNSGVAGAFRLPEAARMSVRTLDRASLLVTEIKLDRDGFGATEPIPYTDAAMIALQMRAIPFHEAMTDGKPVAVHDIRPGDALFYDMRRDPRANVMTRSHSLHLVLSRQLLNQVAEVAEAPAVDEIGPATGVTVRDRQLVRFGKRVMAALHRPGDTNALFISHLALALGLYACGRYGGMTVKSAPQAGPLSPAHMRLAMELISASLDGQIEVAELAGACGMPTRTFVAAFREATGMAPYQWLLVRRVDAARSLLAQGRQSAAEVARTCGFGDENHMAGMLARTDMGPAIGRNTDLH